MSGLVFVFPGLLVLLGRLRGVAIEQHLVPAQERVLGELQRGTLEKIFTTLATISASSPSVMAGPGPFMRSPSAPASASDLARIFSPSGPSERILSPHWMVIPFFATTVRLPSAPSTWSP